MQFTLIKYPSPKSLKLANPDDLFPFHVDPFPQSCIKPITNKRKIGKVSFHKRLIEKKKILKPFTNRKILSKIPFYKSFVDQPNNAKYSSAFKNYAHSLAAEVLEFRAAVVQLISMKTCAKNKFGC